MVKTVGGRELPTLDPTLVVVALLAGIAISFAAGLRTCRKRVIS
jgi:hypothetical protein